MKTSLKMKISGVLFCIGLIVIIGSVGALENDIIGFGRCVWQTAAGLGATLVARILSEGEL